MCIKVTSYAYNAVLSYDFPETIFSRNEAENEIFPACDCFLLHAIKASCLIPQILQYKVFMEVHKVKRLRRKNIEHSQNIASNVASIFVI